MTKVLKLAVLLGLAVVPSFADTVLYQGTFAEDDDSALFSFAVGSASVVTIESWGYAGGAVPTSPDPTVIAAGGFAPNALLYDDTGAEITSDNGGHCGITGADPVTGNCDDPYIQETLGAGTYTLALVEQDNTTVDGTLAGGFVDDGNPGFTCAEFGLTGNFCDITTAFGTERTGNYAVSISVDETGAPEPASWMLCLIGGCCGAVRFYRRDGR